MDIKEERQFASLVGIWCKVEVVGENKFMHAFPSHTEDVHLTVLEGEYRPSLFTCWLACVYPERIKIIPLEGPKL
jgi:hypothetical protein